MKIMNKKVCDLASITATLLVLLGQAAPAAAANFTVNTTADGIDISVGNGICATSLGLCSLRAAIQEANFTGTFDTIRIPTVGTLKLTLAGTGEDAAGSGDLDITTDMSIVGSGLGNTIIDGGNLDRVFHVLGGAELYLEGVTVRNGKALGGQGGCILASGDYLSLYGVIVEKCGADEGGGIYVASAGGFEAGHTTIRKNAAVNTGGGLYSASYAQLYDCVIEKNTSAGDAGGIWADGNSLELYSSIVQKNKATTSGGAGIYIGTMTATSYIYTTAILKNKSPQNGGGIRNHDILQVTQVTLEGNKADAGGGLFNGLGGVVTLSGVTFAKNAATTGGGGLSNYGTATLQRVTMVDNTAPAGAGGAIQRASAVSTTLVNTIVKGKDTCDGPVTSVGTNIESLNLCGLAMAGDLVSTDPLLSKLVSFSDLVETEIPLSRFYVPSATSPAIDAGNNTFSQYDQRGAGSIVDGNADGISRVDIGAIEAGANIY